MSRFSELDIMFRASILEELYHAIETAAEQNVSAEFIAGMETAIAVISGDADARPKEIRDAEA